MKSKHVGYGGYLEEGHWVTLKFIFDYPLISKWLWLINISKVILKLIMYVYIIFAVVVNIRVCARYLLTSQLQDVHSFFCCCCFFALFLNFSGISVGTPLTGDLMDSENIDHTCFAPICMYAGTLLKLIKRAFLGTSFFVTFRWETFRLLSNSTAQA